MRNDQSETITLAPRYVRQSICTIEPNDFLPSWMVSVLLGSISIRICSLINQAQYSILV